MGKLVRRTLGGDEVVEEWSADDPDSVRRAADALRREVDAGYVAVESGEAATSRSTTCRPTPTSSSSRCPWAAAEPPRRGA